MSFVNNSKVGLLEGKGVELSFTLAGHGFFNVVGVG